MFTLLSYTQKSSDITPSVTNFFRVSAANSHYKPCNPSPMNNNEDATILREQAYNVMETVEDNVEYLCDEYMMSGEKVWVMISALCDAKLANFPHEE